MPLPISHRENCRRKRAKELAQMKLIEKQFAHRHVSKLKRKDGAGVDQAPPEPVV